MASNTESHLKETLQATVKKAYVPIVEDASESQNSLIESKFGGKPFTSMPKYSWPTCGQCNKHMQFFLQLNSSKFPSKLRIRRQYFNGLLQLFYCTDECNGAWEAFSDTHAIRVIKPSDLINKPKEDEVATMNLYPLKRVTGWKEVNDYVSSVEYENIETLKNDQYEAFDSFRDEFAVISGEKLFGWPLWVQGIEYPKCRQCQKTMRLLFQVDSEHNIPYMFGDCGVGHITQCEDHKDELAFGWACS